MLSKKWYLLVVCLLFAEQTFSAGQLELCTQKECSKNNKTCVCYCSRQCGPRTIKEDDEPIWDSKRNLCFCKKWDQDNYKERGCDIADQKKSMNRNKNMNYDYDEYESEE